MGSRGQETKLIVSKTDLNAGMGNAWAGHSRASSEPNSSLKDRTSVFWENFGFAPPMGSNNLRDIASH